MSTPTLSPARSLSGPQARLTLLVVGVIVAIAVAITVVALNAGTTTHSAAPRLVQAGPRVGVSAAATNAAASDAAHFGNPVTASSPLSSGMGHR